MTNNRRILLLSNPFIFSDDLTDNLGIANVEMLPVRFFICDIGAMANEYMARFTVPR